MPRRWNSLIPLRSRNHRPEVRRKKHSTLLFVTVWIVLARIRNADNADSADNADNADSAGNAGNADNADSAGSAGNGFIVEIAGS